MKRAALWSLPVVLVTGALALWMSSRMRTDPLPALPPPALERFWIEARLDFIEDPEGFAFRVSGSTGLPAETALRVRVFAVEEVFDPRRGIREDEEPLVWENDGPQPPFRDFLAGGGPFALEACRFRRRPYSLRYRARVTYDPGKQTEEIRLLVGGEEVSVAAEFRLGSEPAYASELRERVAEAQEDLEELDRIRREIRGEIARQETSSDPEAWHAWLEIWRPRLSSSLGRNQERFELWSVWPERVARMKLGATGEYLSRVLDDATALLLAPSGVEGAGDRERAARLKERLAALAEFIEETRGEVGFDGRLDPEVFGPLLSRYERALEGLPVTRGDALTALLRCAPPLRHRRRSYAALNDVGFGLARLIEAPGPETRAAHDRALASFKSLAGLE